MPPSLDSTIKHYISTIAHHGSLSHERKATKRSEDVTSLRSIAQLITDYHAYTECMQIPPYSGPTAVVLYILKHHSHNSSLLLSS